MPSLGADMESGTVVKWLVQPGDEVHRGDIVAEVETEKSNIEVEIFENGVIGELLVPEGERVPVGTPLARVLAAARPVAGHPREPSAAIAAPAVVPTGPAPLTPAVSEPVRPSVETRSRESARAHRAPDKARRRSAVVPPTPERVLSPVLRNLAGRLGVDLGGLRGSGPGDVITREDIERAARPSIRATGRTRSSPFARRQAAELGIDLGTVRGTGPCGAVVEEDVRRAARKGAAGPAPPSPTAAVSAVDRQAALRRSIGNLMARSKREIPHYYLSTTIDLSSATQWLAHVNLERPLESRLVLSVLLLKATALAAKQVPEMNGFYSDDIFRPSDAVHVGVAISLRSGGVIAPAVHDVDRLGLDELMRKLKDLVGRTRRGTLRSSEMSDPTITVSNLGDLGVEAVYGVIYPPQVALVGFGRVVESPYAKDGLLGVRPVVTATLSADHRVSDGHRGGRFLTEIGRLLREPEKL